MRYTDDMKKTLYPKQVKDIKGKTAIAELQRAHYVISLLCVAFVFLIIINMMYPLEFDVLLGSIAAALLLIVSATSLATAFALRKK